MIDNEDLRNIRSVIREEMNGQLKVITFNFLLTTILITVSGVLTIKAIGKTRGP